MNVDDLDIPQPLIGDVLQIEEQIGRLVHAGAITRYVGFDLANGTFTIEHDGKKFVLTDHEMICFNVGAAAVIALFADRMGVSIPPSR